MLKTAVLLAVLREKLAVCGMFARLQPVDQLCQHCLLGFIDVGVPILQLAPCSTYAMLKSLEPFVGILFGSRIWVIIERVERC